MSKVITESTRSSFQLPQDQRINGIYYFFIHSPLKNLFLSCFSMNVFKVLGFDPYTMQSSQPVGGPSPPQDALVFLSKLSSTISQLLQAFSRYLGPIKSTLSFIPSSVPLCGEFCAIHVYIFVSVLCKILK